MSTPRAELRQPLRKLDRRAATWTSRASRRLAEILARSHIDFSEIFIAVWAMGFGFIVLVVPFYVYASSPFFEVLRLYGGQATWGVPVLLLGVFHTGAALGGTTVQRRYAAGLAMVWWAAVAAVYIRVGWPMVAWSYTLAALASVWCYARLSSDADHERRNGAGG